MSRERRECGSESGVLVGGNEVKIEISRRKEKGF
jgi:hypothetical protein